MSQSPKCILEDKKESNINNSKTNINALLEPGTIIDRFERLEEDYKQIAVDRFYDLVVDRQIPLNSYQGLSKEFFPDWYTLPAAERPGYNRIECMASNDQI